MHFFRPSIILALLLVLISCASKPHSQWVSQKTNEQEPKSLEDVRQDLDEILSHHPEIDETKKADLRSIMDRFLKSHAEELKLESKLIQVVLKHADEPEGQDELKNTIKNFYAKRSERISNLLIELINAGGPKNEADHLIKEMHHIYNDFR